MVKLDVNNIILLQLYPTIHSYLNLVHDTRLDPCIKQCMQNFTSEGYRKLGGNPKQYKKDEKAGKLPL